MERVIFVRVGGALALAATLFVASCSSSNIGTSVTMVPSAETAPVAKHAPAIAPVSKPSAVIAPVSKTRTNPPLAVVKPAPVVAPVPKEPEPIQGWVGIERWARVSGVGQVHVVSGGSQPKLELIAPSGRLEFSVGSQFAKWNGLTFLLGFAPQIIAHEIAVNGLDIQKSFLPLIQQRPATLRGRVVVIDPGHGGDQRGTKSVVGNKFEKDFTLDWALRLQTLLASNGWKVYLTRTNDVDIPLHDRVAVADRVQADLFLSLHFNAGSATGTESGIETYCMTPFGMPANLTRGYADDPTYNWPNNAFDRENFIWAMRLHRSLMSAIATFDRGVRRARFMAVLRTQRRPAVLIEGGYLSNRHEATLINTPEYRQKLAQAVANAFSIPKS
ncbi:MAG: N-acetylmuramoyl-L-alanine amidase [Limisphaerales bacterium]